MTAKITVAAENAKNIMVPSVSLGAGVAVFAGVGDGKDVFCNVTIAEGIVCVRAWGGLTSPSGETAAIVVARIRIRWVKLVFCLASIFCLLLLGCMMMVVSIRRDHKNVPSFLQTVNCARQSV